MDEDAARMEPPGPARPASSKGVSNEASLRQAELLDLTHDSIMVRTLDNRITFWNQGAVQRYGWNREEAIGQVSHDLLKTEFPRSLKEIRAELEREGEWEGELVHTTRDGRKIVVDSRWVLRCDALGVPLEILETNNDVTARKRAEEERHRIEEQMRHLQKLESLGLLAGGIAHDFNNLLMAIMGNCGLAQLDLVATSPAQPRLLEVERAAQRAADLCNQLLAYSGKGKFVILRLDLNEVVTEISHLLEVSVSRKAVLRYNLAPDLPVIEADPSQIRQVIMNLITNASDAIGERSGVIAITTGVMECDRAYLEDTIPCGYTAEEGRYVFLEVNDTGCGMDKATLTKLFDPFFTTKKTGRGLGLASVLGIVRGHRGAIRLYSEVRRGTSFKILFPAADGPADDLSLRTESPAPWRGHGTVLVVDDEEVVRITARRVLEHFGFTVLTSVDGLEAVATFRQHAEEIVLVLLDMTMPHLSGEETFRELRRIRGNVLVLLTSGYNEQESTQSFSGKGLAGFIQKPYRPVDLLAKIREILRGED